MAYKKSLGAKYTNLTKEIMQYLDCLGVADNTNSVLVEELVFNIYIADQAKLDITTRGVMVSTRITPEGEEPILKTNPALAIYTNAVRTVQALSSKLGMSPQERKKLNLKAKERDELDDILGS